MPRAMARPTAATTATAATAATNCHPTVVVWVWGWWWWWCVGAAATTVPTTGGWRRCHVNLAPRATTFSGRGPGGCG